MVGNAPSLSEVIADGGWLADRYDETNDTVQFRFVPKDIQRDMTFLNEREIGDAPIAIFSRADCLAEVSARNLPTPPMILHSAYCCSTMLARAFDIEGVSFGLKEPQILNDVVGLQLRGADPRQVAAALDIGLHLLARPLEGAERNVIKPSNLINPSLPLLIAMRPEVRGLLLHAPLATFIASIARKEIEGRAWMRELMWKLIHLGQADRFGFTTEELYRQTDLQVAAVGWLAQQANFAAIAADYAGFRTLDSETLLSHRVETLAALRSLFALEFDVEAAAAGPAFRTHSKDRKEFSPADRAAEQDRGLDQYGREIAMVIEWAHQLAEHAGVPMSLPSPLLS